MLHELFQTWFHWIEQWGYLGVFILMAMESSIFPVPSELVVPPAAYWASQGRMTMTGVILASTFGSLFGSLVTYAVARAMGRPLVNRYGKYFLMPPDKVALAEGLLLRYSNGGIFLSRLLPVVRHLCSIPAGLIRMDIWRFSLLTTVGAAIWCSILAWFGQQVIGDQPDLLTNPDAMVQTLKGKLLWFVGAMVVLAVSYVAMKRLGRAGAPTEAPPPAIE